MTCPGFHALWAGPRTWAPFRPAVHLVNPRGPTSQTCGPGGGWSPVFHVFHCVVGSLKTTGNFTGKPGFPPSPERPQPVQTLGLSGRHPLGSHGPAWPAPPPAHTSRAASTSFPSGPPALGHRDLARSLSEGRLLGGARGPPSTRADASCRAPPRGVHAIGRRAPCSGRGGTAGMWPEMRWDRRPRGGAAFWEDPKGATQRCKTGAPGASSGILWKLPGGCGRPGRGRGRCRGRGQRCRRHLFCCREALRHGGRGRGRRDGPSVFSAPRKWPRPAPGVGGHRGWCPPSRATGLGRRHDSSQPHRKPSSTWSAAPTRSVSGQDRPGRLGWGLSAVGRTGRLRPLRLLALPSPLLPARAGAALWGGVGTSGGESVPLRVDPRRRPSWVACLSPQKPAHLSWGAWGSDRPPALGAHPGHWG